MADDHEVGAALTGLWQQAQEQYPVLKKYDYGYTENFKPNAGFMEHWPAGETGVAPTPDAPLNALRPAALPLDKPGVEIRDPKTRPMDVMGDITSHHLVDVDPTVHRAYQNLEDSMTPEQHTMLRGQYEHAQKNYGETRPYEDWKRASGLPGFLRGYTFQQWPQDFNERAYTPEQRGSLDQLMKYLQTGGQ